MVNQHQKEQNISHFRRSQVQLIFSENLSLKTFNITGKMQFFETIFLLASVYLLRRLMFRRLMNYLIFELCAFLFGLLEHLLAQVCVLSFGQTLYASKCHLVKEMLGAGEYSLVAIGLCSLVYVAMVYVTHFIKIVYQYFSISERDGRKNSYELKVPNSQ